ncbi:MAG: ribonuclease P protein component [Bacteroidota bacterium]
MFKLTHTEKLKSTKEISRLFGPDARRVKAYPLQFIFCASEEDRSSRPVQVAFGVPKRRYRKAVDRNHWKRRLREAYRLNRDEYLLAEWPEEKPQLALMIMLSGPPPESFRQLEKAMKKGLKRVARDYLD